MVFTFYYAEENTMCSEIIDFDCDKLEKVIETVENLELHKNPVNIETTGGGVRFRPREAEIVGTVPTRREISEEEKKETWWTPAEYHGIRLGAKFITKDIRKREKSLVGGIEEAYARALHLACTLSDGDYESLMKNCIGQAFCMKPWCERELSARGLERYTSHKHRYERTEFAEETRAAVLRLASTKSVTEDQLSIFYKEYARSAAIFARFCGEVDYQVTLHKQSTLGRESPSVNNDDASTQTRERFPSSDSRQDAEHVSRKPSQGRLMIQQLSQRNDTKIPS